MVQKLSVCKVVANNRTLYLQLEWKENSTDLFHINIYDGDNAWTGRYSNEFAQQYMKLVDENEEEYRTIVKEALANNNQTISNDYVIVYDFTVMPGDVASAKLTWKKKFLEDEVELEHGSVPIHTCDTNLVKCALIDCLIEQNLDLEAVIASYKCKNADLNVELGMCREKLEKFANIKESLESNLYGKFIQLLNGKKKRIQLLEDNLQKLCKNSNDSNEVD